MFLFKDDLIEPDHERLSERSDKVVRYWFGKTDVYEPELGTAQMSESYLRLTAERILLRQKVLGLSVDAAFLNDQAILRSPVFCGDSTSLAEFMEPSVDVGMAFVPLSPTGGSGVPVLARLYCVKGLRARHFPLSLMDGLLPGMDSWSWFLAGLPDSKFDKVVDGRSWLLAADLLMRALSCGNSSTCANLATRFIVSGDVLNGRIEKVALLRKLELAQRRDYSDFKWILPGNNEVNDMSMPLRKIKKFDSVECAYDFIEKMRNQDTVSLVNMASADSGHEEVDYLGLLRNGADPSETVKDHGRNAAQFVALSLVSRLESQLTVIQEFVRDCSAGQKKIKNAVDEIRAAVYDSHNKLRAMSYYGCVPQMFFMFAKLGDVEMLKQLRDRGFDIDATDDEGATALDFASEPGEDPSVAELLIAAGAKRRGIYEARNTLVCEAVEDMGSGGLTDKKKEHLIRALEYGLSPNAVFDFESRGAGGYAVSYWMSSRISKNIGAAYYEGQRRRYKTTLFLEALYSGDVDLVRLCIEKGADLDSVVVESHREKLSRNEESVFDVTWTDDDFVDVNDDTTIRRILESTRLTDELSRDVVKLCWKCNSTNA